MTATVSTRSTFPMCTANIAGGSEFPALGGQTQSSTAQAWNRINTQSPSQNRATSQQLPPPSLSSQQPPSQPQQQQHESFSAGHKDIFGAMDDYRIPGTVAVGGSVGSGPLQSQMPPSSMDDFPALPRTTSGVALGGLDDRGGLGGIGQRQGVLGSRLLPQLDGALPQQGVLQMGDAEKKVRGFLQELRTTVKSREIIGRERNLTGVDNLERKFAIVGVQRCSGAHQPRCPERDPANELASIITYVAGTWSDTAGAAAAAVAATPDQSVECKRR